MGSITLWSEDEIQYLKENYEKYGPNKCSEHLNRTKRACEIKAKKLGFKFNVSYRWKEEKLRDIVSKNFTKSDCLREKFSNSTIIKKNQQNYKLLYKYYIYSITADIISVV